MTTSAAKRACSSRRTSGGGCSSRNGPSSSPTLKRLNPALKIAYHSDGAIDPIIPDFIEIGLDVLNPVQPACMDPARLKKLYGDHLCFWGTIDEQHTLPFGSPGDVTREVRTRLETVGRNGGLIIGPTHHVQLDTPTGEFLGDDPRDYRSHRLPC